MDLLLDTCSFLWLALAPSQLSTHAEALMNDPGNELFLSDASVLEISIKHSIGKLPLPLPPRLWVPSRAAFFHVQCLPLEQSVLFRSGELPRVHADPFDRLIAAHAIENGLALISPDTPLESLGASRRW